MWDIITCGPDGFGHSGPKSPRIGPATHTDVPPLDAATP